MTWGTRCGRRHRQLDATADSAPWARPVTQTQPDARDQAAPQPGQPLRNSTLAPAESGTPRARSLGARDCPQRAGAGASASAWSSKAVLVSPDMDRRPPVSIQPGDDRPEYHHQNAVEDDLLDNHVPWHRLHDEVDHVGGYDRQQCDGDTKAHALCHPRLRLDAARIDPHERAGQDHMRQEHQGEVLLLVALRPEKLRELHVVGT